MIYARIDLSQTNYEIMDNCKKLKSPFQKPLEAIYDAYCKHKKFKSVMPIFAELHWNAGRRAIRLTKDRAYASNAGGVGEI